MDRLRRLVIDPIFGADELAARGSVDYVPDTAGLDELVRRCDSAGRVGFVMYPLSVDELLAVADEGAMMPPKSSFFYPQTPRRRLPARARTRRHRSLGSLLGSRSRAGA